MASTQSPKAPRMRQARKSLAHVPSTDVSGDKENLGGSSAALSDLTVQGKQASKKSRSKSLGPGGLDALKESTGNKQEPVLPPQFKSILKPTIPLSPPKTIPPHNAVGRASPGKSRQAAPAGKSPRRTPAETSTEPSQSLPNPFETSPTLESEAQSPTRVAVRTEEEQQAAARERERQEMLAHKDARRKSLANRRVSFAPEATLHTWNVVELPEDSTTSSASTNSTRRASGITANTGSPYRSAVASSDASEPPSTPPEQVEELQVAASPAHQRDLHQKKRRRSSAIPPMNFNNPEDFSSSPYSGVSDDTNQIFVTADEIDKDSDSSTSNDDDLVEDETVTGVDGDDNTIHSAGDSTGSSGKLEAALQQAAKQAGTQGIEYDEHGDITMEMADDEVTSAFKPWVKNGQYVSKVIGDPNALQDQENLNPFSPAFKANVNRTIIQNGDATMDMTQAVGGILPAAGVSQPSPVRRRRKSITGNRRRSSVARRRSPGDGSAMGDETMDLTTAIGGIQRSGPASSSEEMDVQSAEEDEELTMEFTSVVGGMIQSNSRDGSSINDQLANNQLLREADRHQSVESSDNDETMDFTVAAGGILPSITERTEPPEEQTQDMDITAAVGAILPDQLSTGNRVEAKILMEKETDVGQLSGSPFFGTPRQKPVGVGLSDERALPAHVKTMASETGSPSLAVPQSRTDAKKSLGRLSMTPKSQHPTPVKEPDTPSKQLTPQPIRPMTPGKTPPSKNVTMRTASPKRLFKAEIKASGQKAPDLSPRLSVPHPLFRQDLETGATTPSIVLKPKRRRSSGLGVDRKGLGSPRVTALLDRRGSIGEHAKAFVAQGPAPMGVRFENPQVMEQELDHERAEDQSRESGRGVLQREADSQDLEEKDATANLKDMIESLTPQKKKLKGRKSLHVGAAKGLLGKRPAELDEDEDEDGTPKRLKGREGSPVKKVKLPAPPSKTATTGRTTRSTRHSLAEASGNGQAGTPTGHGLPLTTDTTPKGQTRFKNAEGGDTAKVQPFDQKIDASAIGGVAIGEDEDRIHLQDFLNMTSIRFMELTTTKRRHTVVPHALTPSARKSVGAQDHGQGDTSNDLESCVVAGACTVPMLELYQHSCRELKNYISEGRSIVKEIEADTYEDNPQLFREYISAPPDIKSIMDNQFKNVKTHARLLSKAMWYEWRMKLLDGLKEGLLKIGEGIDQDGQSLTQQEQLLQPVLPGLIEKHEQLESQVQVTQAHADELADCDQDELLEARECLLSIEQELEAKQKFVEELHTQLREKENILVDVVERKQECIDDIKEAEKIRWDCRGWSSKEVLALQANVNALEEAYGWTITSVASDAITMTYNRTLQLFFTPSSFESNESNTSSTSNNPISLTYIADTRLYHPQPLTTDKRFFLQIMRAQLQCLDQSRTSVQELLAFVSNSWDAASSIVEEAGFLGVGYISESSIMSDEAMVVRASILLRAMRTKVEVGFEVRVTSGEGAASLGIDIKSSAKVCYGEGLKEKKMSEFLESKIKGVEGRGVWVRAVGELEERLIARGGEEGVMM